MNLLIDIGNTLAKIRISSKNKIIKEYVFQKFDDHELKNILNKYEIKFSIISNVSKPTPTIISVLKKHTDYVSLKQNVKKFIFNDIDISEVGDDRLALFCSALSKYPKDNVLVIDLGTCITYDLKTSKNEYMPGGISPGMYLRLNSISDSAFNIDVKKLHHPTNLLAKDTISSLSIGIIKGIQYEIEGFIYHYSKIYDKLRVVINGGDSKLFAGKIKNTIFTNSNFIFEGLELLISKNN